MVPLDVVPIASLLQIGIPTIATTIGISSSTILLTSIADDSIKLVESMENMSIQGEEINKLRQEAKVLQEQRTRFENALLIETCKSQALSQRL